jgi:hypothetical protein
VRCEARGTDGCYDACIEGGGDIATCKEACIRDEGGGGEAAPCIDGEERERDGVIYLCSNGEWQKK